MNTEVYAARAKNRFILDYCSSGGAFSVLSDWFIEQDGAILCSGYNYNLHRSEFKIVHTVEERDKCRGSMYIQSYTLDSWREAISWIKNNPGKALIFFGTGCQAVAFKRVCEINNIINQVTVVDLICHGVPSPLIWKDYIVSKEKKGRIENINMRDKRKGWDKSIARAYQNGHEVSLSEWRKIYSSRKIIRPCCSQCPYTKIDRETDITIGDFWHIEKSLPEFYDKKGTSLILIHTEKGKELFESVQECFEYKKSNIIDCWQENLEKPTKHANDRERFWNEYQNRGIDYVVKKYGRVKFLKKVFNKIKRITGY